MLISQTVRGLSIQLTCIFICGSSIPVLATTSLGSCGTLGCATPSASSLEVLSASLLAPEITKRVGTKEVTSLRKTNDLPLTYHLQTDSRCFVDIRIESIPMPMPVDGISPIEVEGQFFIVTADEKSSCSIETTTEKKQ